LRGRTLRVARLALGVEFGAHLRALAGQHDRRRAALLLQFVNEATEVANILGEDTEPHHFGPDLPFLQEVVAGQCEQQQNGKQGGQQQTLVDLQMSQHGNPLDFLSLENQGDLTHRRAKIL
jgi:hypothetical protein